MCLMGCVSCILYPKGCASLLPNGGVCVSCILQHLRSWQQEATASRQQRESEDEIVSAGLCHLLRARAVRLLHAWKVFAEEEVCGRLGEARARGHYHQVLREKVWRAWCLRHQLMARKRLLSRQCEAYRDARLVSGCYAQWRRQVSIIGSEMSHCCKLFSPPHTVHASVGVEEQVCGIAVALEQCPGTEGGGCVGPLCSREEEEGRALCQCHGSPQSRVATAGSQALDTGEC